MCFHLCVFLDSQDFFLKKSFYFLNDSLFKCLYNFLAFLLFQVAHAQTVRYKAHAWLCHLLAAQPCTFEPKCLICDIVLITNNCFRKCRKCIKGLKDQVSKPQSAMLTISMTSLLLPSLSWTCCVLWVLCHWGNKWSKEKKTYAGFQQYHLPLKVLWSMACLISLHWLS